MNKEFQTYHKWLPEPWRRESQFLSLPEEGKVLSLYLDA